MDYGAVRRVLKRKRTIEILDYLSENGAKNYTEIENSFEASSDTISNTLSLLDEYQLINRREKTKKNVRYETTDRGEELLELVREINKILSQDSN